MRAREFVIVKTHVIIGGAADGEWLLKSKSESSQWCGSNHFHTGNTIRAWNLDCADRGV
jgi:hypothetical protein